MTEAYPLSWPDGWPRTAAQARKRATFRASFDAARYHLFHEVRRLGGRLPILSTNIPLRLDGMPRADWARTKVDDPGVAIYFTMRGKQHVVACDHYELVQENLRAVGLSIACLRGLSRYGASTLMERAFSGFAQLPAPGARRSCWDVLGMAGRPITNEHVTAVEAVEAAFRVKLKQHHPDVGGTDVQMAEINDARAKALREVGA